ncbi:MAG: transglycosylase domain-containing protein [Bacteroidales bacterium]|nr:transglycosylase domain-containing protein [Bacteroidales bacterium]
MAIRIGVFGDLPTCSDLRKIKNNIATNIYSVDDELLGRYYYQNRTNAKIEDIPKHLINALIATEDIRFYKHKGIDSRSTLRVLVKTIILMNRSSGGGSTITQQLAKNLYPRKNYGLFSIPVAKVKEIMLARRMEKLYTKEEILELYLNTVSFGENTYGIETAALIFFGKSPSELTIDESAVLVGLLKANTSYNPRLNSKAAFKRRNVVLSQMHKYGFLKKEALERLKQKRINLKYRKLTNNEGAAAYFREYLRRSCVEILKDKKSPDGSPYNLYTDGLKIYTTINAKMQEYLENSVKKHLTHLQKQFDKQWKGKEPWVKNPNLAMLQIKQSKVYKSLIKKGLSKKEALIEMKKPRRSEIFTWQGMQDTLISPLDSLLHYFKMLQTGALVMHGGSGDILAWVGGSNYKYFQYDHVTSKRQTGSIIKPVVYAAALEKGINPCDFYENDSVVYEDYNNWVPQNSGKGYGGYYSVKGALANSVNTISVKLLLEAGIDSTIDLAHKMGISSDLPKVPSMALGVGEVSLLEMVQVYSVIQNKGMRVFPRMIRRIEDIDGNIIYSDGMHKPKDSILSKATSEKVLAMMQGVVERGTARGLRNTWNLEGSLAGKTGTTQGNTDAWFMGMNSKLVVGVWVGGDNPIVRFRSTYGQGAYAAMPIFARFMRDVYKNPKYSYLKNKDFNISDSIQTLLNCNDFQDKIEPKIIREIKKKEESIGNFIRRLFKRKRKKDKDNAD